MSYRIVYKIFVKPFLYNLCLKKYKQIYSRLKNYNLKREGCNLSAFNEIISYLIDR